MALTLKIPKRFDVIEDVTAQYNGQLKDETGANIGSTSVTALDLSLFDKDTNTFINSRGSTSTGGQDVLNKSNVTLSTSGALVWQIQPSDNKVITAGKANETHIARFDFEYGSGQKGRHPIALIVRNLANVVVA